MKERRLFSEYSEYCHGLGLCHPVYWFEGRHDCRVLEFEDGSALYRCDSNNDYLVCLDFNDAGEAIAFMDKEING